MVFRCGHRAFYAWLGMRGRVQEYEEACRKKRDEQEKNAVSEKLRKIEEEIGKINQGSGLSTWAQFEEIWNAASRSHWFAFHRCFSAETIWSLVPKNNACAAANKDIILTLQFVSWFGWIYVEGFHDGWPTILESSKVSKDVFMSKLWQGRGHFIENLVRQDLFAKLMADGFQGQDAATFVWDKVPGSASGEVSVASFVAAFFEITSPPVVIITIRASRSPDGEVHVHVSLVGGESHDVMVSGKASVAEIETPVRDAFALGDSFIIRFISSDGAILKPECLLQDMMM